MAHQTYISIRYQRADDELHLFLKNSDGSLHFFISTDIAINGSYRYENIRADFCKRFEIEPAYFASYYAQELDIDLSDVFQQNSISIAEIRVDEIFFQKVIKHPDHYEWVEKEQLDIIKDKLLAEHDIVLTRLQIDDKLTNLDSDLLEGIRVLQRAQSQQRLVIFAGAGISKDSGIPLWNEIKQEMLSVLGSPEIFENTDPTIIAQYLFKARGQKEYNEKIRGLLGFYKNPRPNAIHKAIANLRPRHIITTNFDNLLENALPDPSPYSVIRYDQDFPYAYSDRFLVKMHGDWQLMNFVFKEDDYLSYSRKWPLTEGFIRGIFASHVVLFIGFSFTDRNLKQILDWVKDILRNDLQPAYLFLTDERNEHEQSYFKSKGLHLLSWPKNYKQYLEKIGQRLTKGNSTHAERISDFLNFLNSDNLIEYERIHKAKNQLIIDQMYDALRDFHALNSLPPYSLQRLFPFSPFRLSRSKKQADAEFNQGRLDIRNEAIIQLMQSIEVTGNQISISKSGPINKEIMSVNDYQNKLWYIFDKLRSSGVKCIHREGDERHHPIKIDNPFSEQLLFPKWFEFRLDKVLEAIEKREYAFGQPDWIPSPLRDGLLDGYVLYQMNFFDLAYDVFQKVENEAAWTGDFALYFLSRRNREKTSRQIYWRRFSGDYSKNFSEQVKIEADALDLYETLRTIKVEIPVRQLLQEIQEGVILKRFTGDIEGKYLKILETFSLFHDQYSVHIGPHFAEQLEWAFERLCDFYSTNGLILDDTQPFEKAAEQTFEGLIASYQTSNRYENRYQAFQIPSLLYCIRWINPKSFATILRKYAIKDFPFENGHKEVFINWCINLFKSCSEIDNFFGNISENRLIHNYLKDNSLYSTDEKRLFPNMLRVLALVDLDDTPELASSLCNSVLNCQQTLPRYLADTDVFILFYQPHLQFFSYHQIEIILNTFHKTQKFHSHYLQKLANRLKEVHPDYRLVNPILFRNLLSLGTGENEQERLSALIKFYDFLDEPLQSQLMEAIRVNLKSTVGLHGLHLYCDARLSGCISQELFPEKVKEALKRIFSKINQIQFTPDGNIEPFESDSKFGSGELPHNYAWIVTKIGQLQSTGSIDKRDRSWLLKQPELPSCLRWLIDPKKFDYAQFDHFWLFFLEGEDAILEKLGAQSAAELKEAIQKGLHKQFSKKIAEIYFKYFFTSSQP